MRSATPRIKLTFGKNQVGNAFTICGLIFNCRGWWECGHNQPVIQRKVKRKKEFFQQAGTTCPNMPELAHSAFRPSGAGETCDKADGSLRLMNLRLPLCVP